MCPDAADASSVKVMFQRLSGNCSMFAVGDLVMLYLVHAIFPTYMYNCSGQMEVLAFPSVRKAALESPAVSIFIRKRLFNQYLSLQFLCTLACGFIGYGADTYDWVKMTSGR